MVTPLPLLPSTQPTEESSTPWKLNELSGSSVKLNGIRCGAGRNGRACWLTHEAPALGNEFTIAYGESKIAHGPIVYPNASGSSANGHSFD